MDIPMSSIGRPMFPLFAAALIAVKFCIAAIDWEFGQDDAYK